MSLHFPLKDINFLRTPSFWNPTFSSTLCEPLLSSSTIACSLSKYGHSSNIIGTTMFTTQMVLFGSQLKIQIPPLPPSVLLPADSPMSPGDFGAKTRNFPMGCFSAGVSSPSSAKKSPFVLENLNSPRAFTGNLSASEMELSEDYTCVISRGPNPRTTHIFDDCIVESCCGVVGFAGSTKGNQFSAADRPMSYQSESFLSFCYSCKKNLRQGTDIYMYRGEKAFCSSECRFKKILEEEELGKLEPDDGYGTCP